ncbi:hypothetical protein MTO96_039649 [Rhipicephalus appendiculatus]
MNSKLRVLIREVYTAVQESYCVDRHGQYMHEAQRRGHCYGVMQEAPEQKVFFRCLTDQAYFDVNGFLRRYSRNISYCNGSWPPSYFTEGSLSHPHPLSTPRQHYSR